MRRVVQKLDDTRASLALLRLGPGTPRLLVRARRGRIRAGSRA